MIEYSAAGVISFPRFYRYKSSAIEWYSVFDMISRRIVPVGIGIGGSRAMSGRVGFFATLYRSQLVDLDNFSLFSI